MRTPLPSLGVGAWCSFGLAGAVGAASAALDGPSWLQAALAGWSFLICLASPFRDPRIAAMVGFASFLSLSDRTGLPLLSASERAVSALLLQRDPRSLQALATCCAAASAVGCICLIVLPPFRAVRASGAIPRRLPPGLTAGIRSIPSLVRLGSSMMFKLLTGIGVPKVKPGSDPEPTVAVVPQPAPWDDEDPAAPPPAVETPARPAITAEMKAARLAALLAQNAMEYIPFDGDSDKIITKDEHWGEDHVIASWSDPSEDGLEPPAPFHPVPATVARPVPDPDRDHEAIVGSGPEIGLLAAQTAEAPRDEEAEQRHAEEIGGLWSDLLRGFGGHTPDSFATLLVHTDPHVLTALAGDQPRLADIVSAIRSGSAAADVAESLAAALPRRESSTVLTGSDVAIPPVAGGAGDALVPEIPLPMPAHERPSQAPSFEDLPPTATSGRSPPDSVAVSPAPREAPDAHAASGRGSATLPPPLGPSAVQPDWASARRDLESFRDGAPMGLADYEAVIARLPLGNPSRMAKLGAVQSFIRNLGYLDGSLDGIEAEDVLGTFWAMMDKDAPVSLDSRRARAIHRFIRVGASDDDLGDFASGPGRSLLLLRFGIVMQGNLVQRALADCFSFLENPVTSRAEVVPAERLREYVTLICSALTNLVHRDKPLKLAFIDKLVEANRAFPPVTLPGDTDPKLLTDAPAEDFHARGLAVALLRTLAPRTRASFEDVERSLKAVAAIDGLLKDDVRRGLASGGASIDGAPLFPVLQEVRRGALKAIDALGEEFPSVLGRNDILNGLDPSFGGMIEATLAKREQITSYLTPLEQLREDLALASATAASDRESSGAEAAALRTDLAEAKALMLAHPMERAALEFLAAFEAAGLGSELVDRKAGDPSRVRMSAASPLFVVFMPGNRESWTLVNGRTLVCAALSCSADLGELLARVREHHGPSAKVRFVLCAASDLIAIGESGVCRLENLIAPGQEGLAAKARLIGDPSPIGDG